MVVFSVNHRARSRSRNLEISKTKRFISIALAIVNIDLDFSRVFKVRNLELEFFIKVIPSTTTNISRISKIISVTFMNDLSINIENNTIISISWINEVTSKLNVQEWVRRNIGDLSWQPSTTTSNTITTKNFVRASSNTLFNIRSPFANIEIRVIKQFSNNNWGIRGTKFRKDIKFSDTPRSSSRVVASNVGWEFKSEFLTRDWNSQINVSFSVWVS